MPYIDSKITVPVPDEKREALKTAYGDAISVFGKTEEWVMVHIEDGSELFLGGKKLDRGACVDVSLMGEIEDDAVLEYTKRVCKVLEDELDIPGKNVYVTFHSIPPSRWGWDSQTF